MDAIRFTPEERKMMLEYVRRYLYDEFTLEIGQFEAEFFLQFIDKRLGPHYYNQGLRDAQLALNNQREDLMEALYGLEKPLVSLKSDN